MVECNSEIFKLVKRRVDLSRILNNKNITLITVDNRGFYSRLKSILSIDGIKLAIHKSSLNLIPMEYIELKQLLEEFIVKENSIKGNEDKLYKNFIENIENHDKNVDALFNKHRGQPLFLISAGPSLDKNIYEFQKVKDKGIILSVGRAVRPLISAGIIPDYIIITDPSDVLYYNQLRGLDIEVPIIVLSTCDKNVMLNYKGYKYIALQEGYGPAEDYGRCNNNKLVETGGSVATTGLDIAIRMGCNPIVFVGQDLAFTDKRTHSEDTYPKKIIDNNMFREVEDIYGNIIKTSKNLSIYLRWIQNRIFREKGINFMDATEGGAKIKGTKIIGLDEVIDSLN